MREKQESSFMERRNENKLSFFAKEREVKSTYKSNRPMILFLYKESYFSIFDIAPSLPSCVVFLLQKYEDVFSEDIPTELTLVKGIKHQVDFELRASTSNRPPYRSNLEEKEHQRQIEKLLATSHVHESMSLYVVPMLLVPKKNGTWPICVDCDAINKRVKY